MLYAVRNDEKGFTLKTLLDPVVMPQEVDQGPYPTSVTWAVGNWATCEAFGFLGHSAAVSSALYNASLAIYYVVTIRYGWSEWRMQKSRIEAYYFHTIPLIVGWGTGIASLILNLYNPILLTCRTARYPAKCETEQAPNTPCERGKHVNAYRVAFVDFWVWSVFLLLVVCMTAIYMKMAKIDQANSKSQLLKDSSSFQRPPSLQPSAQQSASLGQTTTTTATTATQPAKQGGKFHALKHQFAMQALLYCCAYGITWFFPTTMYILREFVQTPVYIPLLYLINIFLPLQGFWNAFIYIRPRYLRYRRIQIQQQQQRQERKEAEQQQPLTDQQAAVAGGRRSAFFHAVSVEDGNDDDDEDEDDIDDENCGSECAAEDPNMDGGNTSSPESTPQSDTHGHS
jgi:hypothetical protein